MKSARPLAAGEQSTCSPLNLSTLKHTRGIRASYKCAPPPEKKDLLAKKVVVGLNLTPPALDQNITRKG